MSSSRIHRLVALCLSIFAFVLFLALWISGGDQRDTDHLIWTILSLVGTGVAAATFALDFRNPPVRTDWAIWALPSPFLLAGLLSAFV